ncbi:hypothetical protein ACH5RR_034269, partial [Cinchona calisaya]
ILILIVVLSALLQTWGSSKAMAAIPGMAKCLRLLICGGLLTRNKASKILLTGKDRMVSLNLSYARKQFLLKVISNMIMSLEPTGEEQEKFRANFKVMSCSFSAFEDSTNCFLSWMYEMLDLIIAQWRTGENFQQDFLESLVKKYNKHGCIGEDDDKLTEAQLKDNILTLLVAGHYTTAAALTWLIKFLEEIPAALECLRVRMFNVIFCTECCKQNLSDLQEEHREVQGGGSCLTWSVVNNMAYTNKAICETLRIATILPWFQEKLHETSQLMVESTRPPTLTSGTKLNE